MPPTDSPGDAAFVQEVACRLPLADAALSAWAYLLADLHEELVGLHRLLSPEELSVYLPSATSGEEVRAGLRALLGAAWSASWLKAVNKKPRPHKPKAKQSGAHTSVHKILQAAKADRGEGQKV